MYVRQGVLNTKRVFPDEHRYGLIRCDMNENPEGLPADFVNGVLSEITPEFLATYPEQGVFCDAYSAFIGVGAENVLPTNGTDSAIRYILETFGEAGKDIVTVHPTFGMYGVNCSIFDLKHKPVPYNDDLSFSTQKLLDAIDENTRVVVILNPNNPVGDAFSLEDMQKIATRASEVGAVVLVDEAYHYFYDETFLPLVKDADNILLLRTFSKLFSLAALRLGVVIGNKTLIDYIRRARLTFEVNSVALLFGTRLLQNRDIIDTLIKTEHAGKEYLSTALAKHGYKFLVGKGNFVLVHTKTPAQSVAQRLFAQNVLVHTFGTGPLEKYIRISTGSTAIMERVCRLLFEVDK